MTLRSIVLTFGLLGCALFGGAFVASFLSPLLVERAAREVIRLEVQRRVERRIDALSDSAIAAAGRAALAKVDADLERSLRAIRQDLPAKVAGVVAEMLDADCECRKRLVEHARRAEHERFSSLAQLRARLATSIESAYASVSAGLLREFRIFTGSNALAFALLAATVRLRPRATWQLLVPAAILGGAVVLTAGLYLFNQNWLHTIVYADYTGFAYSLYLAAVALLLADLLLNRARVTARIASLVLRTLGSAANASPC